MQKSPLPDNKIFVLFETLFGFFTSTVKSIFMVFHSLFRTKEVKPLAPNRFLELLHFIFVSGPKHFWKKPTALAMGRSLSTLLHFIFERDKKFTRDNKKGGFTLMEVLIAVTLLSIVLVFSFDSLGQIAFLKTRTADRIDLSRDLYTNIEQIASLVKESGDIDYEEYWNRQAVGLTLSGGHFAKPSGFGNYGEGGVIGTNFGNGFYYCLSGNGIANALGTNGCLENHNTTASSQSGVLQRYGQYAYQFIDLNGDHTADAGDTDSNGSPFGDLDDEDLGAGPFAIGTGSTFPELYLFKKWDPSERILLRYHIIADTNAPTTGPLAPATPCNPTTATGSIWNGCRGTIEMLRLVGRDLGIAHTGALTSSWLFDGKIDTWQCRSDFKCLGPENTPTGADEEWVPLFSDDINVRSLSFDIEPRRDFHKNWKNASVSSDEMIAPYVRMNISMGFAWKKRAKMPSSDPSVTVTTTLNLTQ